MTWNWHQLAPDHWTAQPINIDLILVGREWKVCSRSGRTVLNGGFKSVEAAKRAAEAMKED